MINFFSNFRLENIRPFCHSFYSCNKKLNNLKNVCFDSDAYVSYPKPRLFRRVLSQKRDINQRPLEDTYKKIIELESYFHDGSILSIEQHSDHVKVALESSEICDSIGESELPLSSNGTLKGILYFEDLQSISIDDQLFQGALGMMADTAGLIRIDLSERRAHFFVEWINYPPKPQIEKYSDIVLLANRIFWENRPDLGDPFRVSF